METVLISLVIIVIVAALLWMVRGRQSPTRRRATNIDKYQQSGAKQAGSSGHAGIDKLKNNPLFWGLQMGQPGCEAAMSILDRQYPFDSVPELPLPGCSAASCTCQFKGLVERRSWHRRMIEDRRAVVRFYKDMPADRRSGGGRRRGDSWIGHTN